MYEIMQKASYAEYENEMLEHVSIEPFWDAAVNCVKKCYNSPEQILHGVGHITKTVGDVVADFTAGVEQKAIARPARLIAEFSHVVQNNPGLVFAKATDVLFDTACCALETTQLIEALINDPRSERTQQLLDEFENDWVGPLREKVATAAQIFWQMPLKERAQEVVALGLQVFAVVGAAKMAAVLAAQAAAQVALFEASVLLKLDQLSQTFGSVMQTGVGPDGTMSVAIPAIERVSEGVVAIAEQAITVAAGAQVELATTAVVDAVSTMAFAVRDGESGLGGGGAGPKTVKKVKLRPTEELRKRYTNHIKQI